MDGAEEMFASTEAAWKVTPHATFCNAWLTHVRMSAVANTDEERALVDRFLADRDERAFREIYRQHGPALYGFARSLVARDAVVEDIVQEAWLRALRRVPSFDRRSSLRTWPIRFVRDFCL